MPAAVGPAWGGHADDPVVAAALARCTVLGPLHPVGEVGSTQDVALGLAADGAPDGTLVLADRQVAGRGRSGRRWDDLPAGGTLALTLLLDVAPLPPAALTLLPHALGLAVLRACAVSGVAAGSIRLKWPNDVVVRPGPDRRARKLAGILVERAASRVAGGTRDVACCGIGLDVDLRAGGEAPDRICLTRLAGAPPERAALLAALVGALDAGIAGLRHGPGTLLDDYRAVSDTLGRDVRVDLPGGERLVGRATGIDDEGRLVVSTRGSSRAILTGTVRDLEEVG